MRAENGYSNGDDEQQKQNFAPNKICFIDFYMSKIPISWLLHPKSLKPSINLEIRFSNTVTQLERYHSRFTLCCNIEAMLGFTTELITKLQWHATRVCFLFFVPNSGNFSILRLRRKSCNTSAFILLYDFFEHFHSNFSQYLSWFWTLCFSYLTTLQI